MKPKIKGWVWVGLLLASGLALGVYLRPVSLLKDPGTDVSASAGAARAGETEKNPKSSGLSGEASPSQIPPPAGQASLPLNSEDQKKITVLNEILTTKNDNDPRMDTELRNFSPAAKSAIQKKYQETVNEMRNERGTLVFLLGREIKDASELVFFREVLREKPCLSLENCEKTPGGHSGEEEHLEAINETTANYPQLMAVRALVHRANELVDAGQEGSPLYQSILETLKGAQQSPNPKVSELVMQALQDLKRE